MKYFAFIALFLSVFCISGTALAQDGRMLDISFRQIKEQDLKNGDDDISGSRLLEDYVAEGAEFIESIECASVGYNRYKPYLRIGNDVNVNGLLSITLKPEYRGFLSRAVLTVSGYNEHLEVNGVDGIAPAAMGEVEYVINSEVTSVTIKAGTEQFFIKSIALEIGNIAPESPVLSFGSQSGADGGSYSINACTPVSVSAVSASSIEMTVGGASMVLDGPEAVIYPQAGGEYTFVACNGSGRSKPVTVELEIVERELSAGLPLLRISRMEHIVPGAYYVIDNRAGSYLSLQFHEKFGTNLKYTAGGNGLTDGMALLHFTPSADRQSWQIEIANDGATGSYLGSDGGSGFNFSDAAAVSVDMVDGELRVTYGDKRQLKAHNSLGMFGRTTEPKGFVMPGLCMVEYLNRTTTDAATCGDIVPVYTQGKSCVSMPMVVSYVPEYRDDNKHYYLCVNGIVIGELSAQAGGAYTFETNIPATSRGHISIIEKLGNRIIGTAAIDADPWEQLRALAIAEPSASGKYIIYNEQTRALDVVIPLTADTSLPYEIECTVPGYPQATVITGDDGGRALHIPGYITGINIVNGKPDTGGIDFKDVAYSVTPVFTVACEGAAERSARSAAMPLTGTLSGQTSDYVIAMDEGKISGIVPVIETDHTAPRYYSIDGCEVAPADLTPGTYIRLQGTRATKISVR